MIAVVHLVWGPLGTQPLQGFLDSYRRHPAGAEHELVLLLNGVGPDLERAIEERLEGIEHRIIETDGPMLDLEAYRQAAQLLEHDRVCFLNSYSRLLATGWLQMLERALNEPGAGMVGASGSWGSVRSAVLNLLFLPNPYRQVFPPRRVARELLRGIDRERAAAGSHVPAANRSLVQMLLGAPRALPRMVEEWARFDGFPAPHVRTNGFMLDRSLFLDLRMGAVERKMDAYALEGGRHSFTRQIQRLGLRALVVDRHGASWEPEHWSDSRVLWQGDQEGLMVADNQTELYARGSLDRRGLLSALAWGSRADPQPPRALLS